MICIGSFSAICAPNLHIKEPRYGFEYILVKSQTHDKTAYRLSVFDVDKLHLVEKKDLSLDRYGFLCVSPEDIVHSICGDSSDPRIGLEHMNRIRTDNRMENIRYTVNPYWHSDEVSCLPLCIKWDEQQKRFSFEDHPLVQITSALAEKECVPFYTHDVIDTPIPCAQKLHDCIYHMLHMFEVALQNDVEYKPRYMNKYDDKMRQKLCADYQSFLQFAQQYDAQNFPISECISEYNSIIYEKEYCMMYLDSLARA